jgi:Domain of unknown function (DUF6438)
MRSKRRSWATVASSALVMACAAAPKHFPPPDEDPPPQPEIADSADGGSAEQHDVALIDDTPQDVELVEPDAGSEVRDEPARQNDEGVAPEPGTPRRPRGKPFLERTKGPCYGRCPAYTVKLWSNGYVEFYGEANTNARGTWAAKLPSSVARRLRAAFLAAGFFSIPKGPGPCRHATDMALNRVTLRVGGRSRTIERNSGGPCYSKLKPLEERVDESMAGLAWIECKSRACTPAGQSVSAGRAECSPPHYVDKHGVRRVKPECM